ncbi:MAG: recombinase family protein [Myxococcales bacterium]|nr:recombinase family protein [Myxococcales bacterium]
MASRSVGDGACVFETCSLQVTRSRFRQESCLYSETRQSLAREYGFRDVVVIDEDLGRSASGAVDRPGFRRLLAQICDGTVGAVYCSEASRLSRNGRDWQQLLDLCGFFDARVINPDGVYAPSIVGPRPAPSLESREAMFSASLA